MLAGAALWERPTNKSGGSADEEDKSLLLGDEPEPPEHRQLLADDANERPFPPQLRFPGLSGPLAFRKSLEIIFSDLSANLVLLQAYRFLIKSADTHWFLKGQIAKSANWAAVSVVWANAEDQLRF